MGRNQPMSRLLKGQIWTVGPSGKWDACDDDVNI
jgi:hypothetical protein